ncbi:MAG: threonine aldolase [Chloroflexota bacterium]|nr:threonine aldolase [Chloroflexota bacterium]
MAFKNGIIDLRSDTVTHPTEEMRAAMAAAPVGDDVYNEDPTVIQLEQLAAERTGKEAGLFVASGTMGNLIAALTHCGRGDEAVMGTSGHTFLHEVGGISALGGIFPALIPNQEDGTLAIEDIQNAFREEDIHHPPSRLLILENTQNQCGGIPLSVDYMHSAGTIAHSLGMSLHLDGARVFNAATALGVPAADICAPVDSVMFCLSKGLCAPVGSMLCGSKDFIAKARKIRKQLGGGMRQAGIIAAAGIIAIEKMTLRLAEDHQNAKDLAAGLQSIKGLTIVKGGPQTNMVFFRIPHDFSKSVDAIKEELKAQGVLVGMTGPSEFRLVTHYWIDAEDVKKTVQAVKSVLAG